MLIVSPHNRLAEYKGANHELASPLSILHDHSYCQKDGKKPWKHVPAKVLLGWNTARPPLTPQRAVCKRNGFVTKSERIAIVETDNVMDNNISVGWPYFHKTDRSAKFLARLRMKDTRSIQGNTTIDMIKKKKKKKITSRAPKGSLKKKLAGPSAHKIHPPSYNTIMSSTLKLLPTVSPSLITQAQKCAVGVTPTNTFGIISPLKVHPPAGQSPFVQLSSSSSRNSSLSPTAQVKPFSITLHKIPLTRMPVLSETITLE